MNSQKNTNNLKHREPSTVLYNWAEIIMNKMVLAITVALAGLIMVSGVAEAKGRTGSHRYGGYSSHGKGSHYYGGHR